MFSGGALDPTFGNGGKVIAEKIGFPAAAIAVQSDGKVIAVGKLANDFAVARLNVDGKLDQSFGFHGISRADFGGGRGDFATSVAIQPNGKIVVAGRRDQHDSFLYGDQGQFAVARFNTNGTLDNSFDGDGRLTVDFSYGESQANAVAIQPDGRIVVAGSANVYGKIELDLDFYKFDMAVARLMPDGSLDHSFGTLGPSLLNSQTRSGKLLIDHVDCDDSAEAVAIGPDGKIVLAGTSDKLVNVMRLQANGTFDKSFHDGEAILNLQAQPIINDVSAQPDGSIFVVGGIEGNFLVAKLKNNGQSDASFGTSGVVKADFGGNDEASSVVVSREGVLVAGGSGGKFAMARFSPAGLFDGFFGANGKVTTAVANSDPIMATKLTSDGKILAYGRDGSTARYISVTPRVGVFSIDNTAREGTDDASFIVTRDKIYDFKTRVYFNLSGSATFGQDYTSTLTLDGPKNTGALAFGAAGSIAINPFGQQAFVEIPKGQSFVVVPVTLIDDSIVESAETVTLTVVAGSDYSVDPGNTATVTITSNDLKLPIITPGPIITILRSASAATPIGLFADSRIDELL